MYKAKLNPKNCRYILSILFLLVFINIASATTYYVDKDNVHGGSCSDSNTGLSWSVPTCSIQASVDKIPLFSAANESINITVANATYTDTDGDDYIIDIRYLNHNPTYWITLRSEYKYGALLDDGGSGITAVPVGINIMNSSNVIIDGFEINNTSFETITVNSNSYGIQIINNKLHNNSRNYILNCSTESIQLGKHSSWQGGVYYGRALIYTELNSGNETINGNIFYDNGRKKGVGCTPYYDWEKDHYIYSNANYLNITNNIFYQNQDDNFNNSDTFVITSYFGQHHVNISNNVFYAKGGSVIAPSMKYIQVTNYCYDFIISNNIFMMPDNQESGFGPVMMYDWDAYHYIPGASSIKIFSNIIYGNNITTPVSYWQSDTYGHDYTAYNNTYNIDPKFVYFDKIFLSLQNFHLQSTSVGINNGTSIGMPNADFDGVLRSIPPEIGIYEYTTGSSPPSITSYSNNYSSSTIFTVPSGTPVLFSVGSDQTITNWAWTTANQLSGNGTTNSTASKMFTESGTVTVSGTNTNGTTNTITWTITVPTSSWKIGSGGTSWIGNSNFTNVTTNWNNYGYVTLSGIYNDEFNTGSLDLKWTWIREPTSNWTIYPNYLSINATQGDEYESDDTAHLLMQNFNGGNLTIITRLAANFTPLAYESGGTLFWLDADNYVRNSYYYDGSVYKTLILKEDNNVASLTYPTISQSNPIWLKLVKSGTIYTSYYSYDRITWTNIGSYTLTDVVNKIGFVGLAGSSYTGPRPPVNYDYFVTDNFTSFGNLTTWYDTGTNNQTYKIWTNVTTPSNTNYTVWYRQNSTGEFTQLGGNYTENQSIDIPTKYQNTDVRIRLTGNQTTTPEVISITYFTESTITTPDYMPPAPTNLTNTTEGSSIRYTWEIGAGNITDKIHLGFSANGDTFSHFNDSLITTVLSDNILPHNWFNVTVQAYNSSGNGTLNLTILSQNTQYPNRVPSLYISNQTVNEGDTVSIIIYATDADGDTLTNQTNATYGTISGDTFTWITNYSSAGTYYWNFNTTDTYDAVNSTNILIIVNNFPLNITSYSPLSNPSTDVGISQSFTVNLNRTSNVTWYLNGTNVQSNYSVNSATYTNSTASAGYWNITANVNDTIDSDIHTWWWTVSELSSDSIVPPIPANLTNITGNFYVNYTWNAGVGNITNTFNYTMNGTYGNTNNTYLNTTSYPHGWVNISIRGFNNTGNGTYGDWVSQNTKVPNNPVTIGNISTSYDTSEGSLFTIYPISNDLDSDTPTFRNNITNILYSNISESTTTSATYVKLKTITINDTVRAPFVASFDLHSGAFANTYAKIYKNGISYGVEQYSGTYVYTLKSQIINDSLNTGDTFEVWCRHTGTDQCGVKNFNISYGINYNNNGTFMWNISEGSNGTYNWYINTTDGYGSTSTQNFTVNVLDSTPYISSFQNTTGNFFINWTWGGTNANNYNLNVNNTDYGTISNSYYNTTYYPHAVRMISVRSYNSTLDKYSTFANQTTVIPNNPITISGISDSYSINTGNVLTIDVNYTDLDSDMPTFSRNFTDGSFDISTGILSWSPTITDIGTHLVQINVSDGYGSISTKEFSIEVLSGGGNGTDYDWLDGYVVNTDGNPIVGAIITTSVGTVSSNYPDGYYTLGYIFEHGSNYWVNVSKLGYLSNNTLITFNEDHKINDAMLIHIVLGNITSWNNSYTQNNNLSISIPTDTSVTFNTIADRDVDWSWSGASELDGDGTTQSNASQIFPDVGSYSVISTCSNSNGTCNNVSWTVSVYFETSLLTKFKETCRNNTDFYISVMQIFCIVLLIFVFAIIFMQIRVAESGNHVNPYILVSSIIVGIVAFSMLFVGNYLIYEIIKITGC